MAKVFDEVPVEEYLMTTKEAAAYLGLNPVTLQSWRRVGKGPVAIAVSASRARYRRKDLDSWIQSRAVLGDLSTAAQ